MNFSQVEKENKEVNNNINKTKPITLEDYNNKKSGLNQIKEKINSKKKILTIKNTFEIKKKHLQVNKDIYRRMMKNKTQGELEHFRNNSFKRFYEVKNGINTLHNYPKFKPNLNNSFGFFDREQLKNDLDKMKTELKKINEELNYLKNEEEEAKNKLIANKFIIEKILKIDENEKEEENTNNTNDAMQNRNEKNNDNNKGSYDGSSLYLTQLNKNNNNEITKDETKEENNSKDILNIINQENKHNNNLKLKHKTFQSLQKKKYFERVKYIKIKNRLKVNNFSKLLSTLKREISDYDKSIKSTSKLIETKKNTGKVNIYLNLNNIIEDKNKTLEELSTKQNSLSDVLNNDNKKICLLIIRTHRVIEEQKKLEKIINMNIAFSQEYKDDIEIMKKDKDKLINELNKLEKEKNNMKKIKEQKNEEKRILDEELKKYEDLFKEKNNDEKEINNIHDKEISIKKNITKNDININITKNNLKYDENLLQSYIATTKLYNDYININKQIKYVKEGKYQKIQESIINLNKKLKELSNELTEKNNLQEKLKKELDELKTIYNTKLQSKETNFEKDEINSPNNIEIKIDNEDTKKTEKKKDCIIF